MSLADQGTLIPSEDKHVALLLYMSRSLQWHWLFQPGRGNLDLRKTQLQTHS